MLTALKDKEIMTGQEAVMKYRHHWILFVVTEKGPNPWNVMEDSGYVAYIMDEADEIGLIDPIQFKGITTSHMPGYSADADKIFIGDLEYVPFKD